MNYVTILNQVLIIFLLLFLGCGLFKFKMLRDAGIADMTKLLCYVISPCLILSSFQIGYSPSLLWEIGAAAASAIGVHLAAMLIGYASFNRKTTGDSEKRMFLRFSTIYSNCGVMGLPLLQAIAGKQGLLFGAVYVGVYNLLNWTQGISIYTKSVNRSSAVKGFLNPNVIAIIISFPLFIFSIRLPLVVDSGVRYIAYLNTALSMIVVGTQIAKVSLLSIIKNCWVWIGVLFRNLVVPILWLLVLYTLGMRGVLLLCCVLPAACPVGSFAVIFAELAGKDTRFPSKLVMLSTMTCIVTIPAVVLLEQVLIHLY